MFIVGLENLCWLILLSNHYVGRIVVAVAAHEGSVGEGPERIAFVGTFLGGHKRTLEYDSVILLALILCDRLDAESAFRCECEVVIDEFKVLDAPDSLIAEGAVTSLEH